jgi:DNA-binding NarL/FixJ family response regulator
MQEIQAYESNIPNEVLKTISVINDGDLKNIKMNYNDGNFEFHADSADGNSRIIMKKQQMKGVVSENKVSLQKPNSIAERRERVLHFYKEGLSQTKIADLTMTSQKTVSNDIKALKDIGKLE